MNANWNYPISIRVERGRVGELPTICAEFAIHAPLLIIDPRLAQLPMTTSIVVAYRNGEHDGTIAFGGAA